MGPMDSDLSGRLHETWGGPNGFENRGKEAKVPIYAEEHFARHDLDELMLGVQCVFLDF